MRAWFHHTVPQPHLGECKSWWSSPYISNISLPNRWALFSLHVDCFSAAYVCCLCVRHLHLLVISKCAVYFSGAKDNTGGLATLTFPEGPIDLSANNSRLQAPMNSVEENQTIDTLVWFLNSFFFFWAIPRGHSVQWKVRAITPGRVLHQLQGWNYSCHKCCI